LAKQYGIVKCRKILKHSKPTQFEKLLHNKNTHSNTISTPQIIMSEPLTINETQQELKPLYKA